jgi:hypothetical protein
MHHQGIQSSSICVDVIAYRVCHDTVTQPCSWHHRWLSGAAS